MLQEFINLRQDSKGFRRLFTDDYFDLYLWYDTKGGTLTGFQLCYSKKHNPHAFTWIKDKHISHAKIDEGDNNSHPYKGSPILIENGIFDKKSLVQKFIDASKNIDKDIVLLIIKSIQCEN